VNRCRFHTGATADSTSFFRVFRRKRLIAADLLKLAQLKKSMEHILTVAEKNTS